MKIFVLTKNKMMVLGLTLFLAVSIFMLQTNYAKEVFQYANEKREVPIYNVKREDNKIAISFDAAWGNEDTGQLINIFEKYEVKATFFVAGEWADRYPDSVKALSNAGHEIMNHSNQHPHMTKLSKEDMIKELDTCSDKIEKIIGKRPDLFRAPYGDYNSELVSVCRENGYQTIQWDVDSLDWKGLSADKMMERVVKNTKGGSIIRFHNVAKNTSDALPGIIEKLQEIGFKIVPVSELIYREDYLMEPNGTQIPLTIETSVLD